MNLNSKQKIAILVGIILILISFLVPPCYVGFGDKHIPLGYKPLATFKANTNNILLLHAPTFYAQLISICIITIGFVFILSDKNR